MNKSNYGFKGGKKFSVYVGVSSYGAPSADCITGVKHVWNDFNEKWFLNSKRAIKKISIQRRAYGTSTLGTWNDQKGLLTICDVGRFERITYETVIIHEAAHAWYDKQSRLMPDAVAEFRAEMLRLSPISDYTLKFEGKWSDELYANEMHSAIAQHLYNEKVYRVVCSEQNLKAVIAAYKKLHERCE